MQISNAKNRCCARDGFADTLHTLNDVKRVAELHVTEMVSGQLPPGQLPPGQLPPNNCHLGQLPPRTTAT